MGYKLSLFLQFFMTGALIPDDTSANDQCHWWHQHQTVVYISDIPNRFIIQYIESKQRSRTKQFAEKTYNHQNFGISQSVAHSIEKRFPRSILHSKCFKTPHQDTVGDNQTHIYRELYAHIICKSFQYFT